MTEQNGLHFAFVACLICMHYYKISSLKTPSLNKPFINLPKVFIQAKWPVQLVILQEQ